jgi:uncharacterized membrane protein
MSSQQQWLDVKEAYLKQIEKYLAEVDHPRRPEILRDVHKHMEEKFMELPAEQRNWDNCQRIVTEMGPPEDYAELLTEDEAVEPNHKKTVNRKTVWILFFTSIFIIIVAAVAISVLAYPKMPERMASHWGPGGQVDGWMSRTAGLIFTPGMMVGLTGLFLVILLIDPLRKNIDKFFSYYAGFIVIFNLFMLAVHGWMILWNLNIQIPANVFMPIAMACLFFYIGIILTHVKPNWFIGIRTPWTLSNEIVWQKTHKLGGILFKIAAIMILAGAVFPKYAIVFVLVPVLAVSAVTLIYSFVIWKRIKTS